MLHELYVVGMKPKSWPVIHATVKTYCKFINITPNGLFMADLPMPPSLWATDLSTSLLLQTTAPSQKIDPQAVLPRYRRAKKRASMVDLGFTVRSLGICLRTRAMSPAAHPFQLPILTQGRERTCCNEIFTRALA